MIKRSKAIASFLFAKKSSYCPYLHPMNDACYFNNKSAAVKRNYQQDMREVINKKTALTEIDSLLGKSKPPAFEYIYVTPSLLSSRIFSSDSSVNPYGHSAIRYTNPDDGKSIVMNIVGKPGHRMVNFIPADEYLFGHPSKCTVDDGNEQGGIYLRTMISFRFEEWPDEYIEQMHHYYVKTQKLGDLNMAKYSMIGGPVFNFLKRMSWLSDNMAERGNCAYWTSNGLREAHILNSSTMWPKYTSIKLYTKIVMNKQELWEKWNNLKRKSSDLINQTVGRELISTTTTPTTTHSSPSISHHQFSNNPVVEHNEGIFSRINEKFFDPSNNEHEIKLAPYWNRSNFNIVTYRSHDKRMNDTQLKGWVKPFRSLEHLIFDEMDEMSNVIVQVQEQESQHGSELVAVPSLKEPKHRPLWDL